VICVVGYCIIIIYHLKIYVTNDDSLTNKLTIGGNYMKCPQSTVKDSEKKSTSVLHKED
jgi:hypothetical protein